MSFFGGMRVSRRNYLFTCIQIELNKDGHSLAEVREMTRKYKRMTIPNLELVLRDIRLQREKNALAGSTAEAFLK